MPHLQNDLPLIVQVPQPRQHRSQLLILAALVIPVEVGQGRVLVDAALELEAPAHALFVGVYAVGRVRVRDYRELAELLDDVGELFRELVEG